MRISTLILATLLLASCRTPPSANTPPPNPTLEEMRPDEGPISYEAMQYFKKRRRDERLLDSGYPDKHCHD